MAEQVSAAEQHEAVNTGADDSTELLSLPVSQIIGAEWNARRYFDEDLLRDLGKSLQVVGQVQPVVVRKKGDRYELIAGERRLRAAKLVGITHLNALVVDLDDQSAKRRSLAENLDRTDLNAWDETQGVLSYLAVEFARISPEWPALVKEYKGEIPAAARIVSLSARDFPYASPAALEALGLLEAEPLLKVLDEVFNEKRMTIQSFRVYRLPLLSMPEDLLKPLQLGKMDVSKVLHFARVPDVEVRQKLLAEAQENDWSVKEVKAKVAAAIEASSKKAKEDTPPTAWQRLSALRPALNKLDSLPKPEQRKVERLVKQIEDLLTADDTAGTPEPVAT